MAYLRHYLLRPSVLLMALALAAAACQTADPEVEAAAAATTSAPELTEATATSGPQQDDLEIVSFDGPSSDVALRPIISSALGGVKFSIPETDYLYIDGDKITICACEASVDNEDDSQAGHLALITQGTADSPIRTKQDAVAAMLAIDGLTVEPSGTAVEMFGFVLEGYAVGGAAEAAHWAVFGSSRLGAANGSMFAPNPGSVFFVAETPSGVLYLNPAEVEGAPYEAMTTAIRTLEFTGPGLDPALPNGEFIGPEPTGQPPAAAAEVVAGPPALAGAFSPIEAGTYQLPNFGASVSIEVPQGWFVQPNTAGFTVLTAETSRGPGDRDLTFLGGISAHVPVSGGPVNAGEPTAIANVGSFIDNPPSGWTIENVVDQELAGLSVKSFDLANTQDSSCAIEDPCEHVLTSSWGPSVQLKAINSYRFWWFQDHPAGELLAVASRGSPSDFIDNATAAMESLKQLSG